MNFMKSIHIICLTLATVFMSTAANAASTTKVYMSNTLIFLFLGFCALIVAIQLIPSIIMLYGMIKGALSSKDEKAVATSRK